MMRITECTSVFHDGDRRDAGGVERRALQGLRVPALVWQLGRGERVVRMLDLYRVRISATARSVSWEPVGLAAGTNIGPPDLWAPLSDWAWLQPAMATWWSELELDHRRSFGEGPSPALLWRSERRVRNAVMRHRAVLRHARAAIRAALNLPAELVALALRSRTDIAHVGITPEQVTRVWRGLDTCRAVQRDAPQLLRVLDAAVTARRIEGSSQPLGQLRDLTAREWSPRFWRLVHQCSGRLFVPPLMVRCRSSAWQAVVEYGRVLDNAGACSEPPPAVAEALLRAMFPVRTDATPFADALWCRVQPQLLRLALREASRRRADTAAFIAEEFVPSLAWAAQDQIRANAAQLAAGWPWVQRSQREWARKTRYLAAAASAAWTSALPRCRIGGFDIFPLTDANSLWQEGRAQANCVATRWLEPCRDGRARVFSVRCADSGRRHATVLVFREGPRDDWAVHDVVGFANAPAGDAVEQVAREVCRRCNASAS